MFGEKKPSTKALFARYFQKDKSQFFQCTLLLIYTFDNFFFFFCYKLSTFLAIIDGYIFGCPLIGQSDIIWQA